MIKCVIIDDEPLAVEILETYVAKTDKLSLVASFNNPIIAKQFLQTEEVDLVFLDIEMPQLTGTELAKEMPKKAQFIFTTAYPDYALEGFELSAMDYLVKPIPYPRFEKAVNKVKQWFDLQKEENEFIFVKSEYENIKIALSDILFIEGLKDYLKIHTKNSNKSILTLMSFKEILSKLQHSDFLRIHRSYIINKQHISSSSKSKIWIGEKEIPIGNTYKAEVLKNIGI